MKRALACALLLGCAIAAAAQSATSHKNRWFVSVQGADVLNLYENAFTYRDNGVDLDLFTLQAGAGLGYNFSEAFGIRTQMSFGTDHGAANSAQTAGGGFYPYSFRHVDFFADAVLNLTGLGGRATPFRTLLYAGVGGAYTYGFTDSGHPWQVIVDENFAPGFRLGGIVQYTLPSGVGFFLDLGGELYGDKYSGLWPSEEDQKAFSGYAGFPFDLRGVLTLGVMYLFKHHKR